MAFGPTGSGSASSAMRRLVLSSSSSCRSSGVGLDASGYRAQECGLRALATKAVRRKDGGATPPDSAVVTDAAAVKRRVYKGRNLFEVAQFLPGWGVGAKMAKKHWRADTFYKITDIKLNKDSRHGSAWGVFHDAGVAAGKAQRIGGVHKREWRYLKDVPERVWKSLLDIKRIGQVRSTAEVKSTG